MSGSITVTTTMTGAGLQPIQPAALLANIIAYVTQTNPGYTANLPGSLIDDVTGTDTAALVQCDQMRIDLINSVAPTTANPFMLTQLGNIYGVAPGGASNTSVYVTFTGTVGFVIAQGFVVSDGSHQYAVQSAGIIETGGSSGALLVVATQSGTWSVPSGTVTQIVTSVPGGITLSVTNAQDGTPSAAAETEEQFRARVLQAGLVASTGTDAILKTKLQAIPGVQARLVSVRQIVGTGWEVICGGGDPYAIGLAIYQALPDLSMVTGSVMSIDNATRANPGVVTTVLNHGYATGQVVTFSGVGGMTELNSGNYTITVVDEKNFSIGVDTSAYTAYTSGGVVSPNLRNTTVNINSYPDTYSITFVIPPQQTVNVTLTWNTSASSFVSGPIVNQLAQAAIINYINALAVGQPINLFAMEDAVQQAVSSVLPIYLLTRMVWAISINGISTSPSSGTGEVIGDPESYFYATTASVVVSQG